MIITKTTPYSISEINKLKQQFEYYIKTVIDVEKKICCAGVDLHADGERLLLGSGSTQSQIWGGGIDLETKTIDNNAMINIRPGDNNSSDEIQNPDVRKIFEELSRYYFSKIL
jgi:hypothetical protein